MPSFSSPGESVLPGTYHPVFSAAVVIRIAAHVSPAYFGKGWILLKRHHLWAALKTYTTGLTVEQAQEEHESE